jgi:hypothetical protein
LYMGMARSPTHHVKALVPTNITYASELSIEISRD